MRPSGVEPTAVRGAERNGSVGSVASKRRLRLAAEHQQRAAADDALDGERRAAASRIASATDSVDRVDVAGAAEREPALGGVVVGGVGPRRWRRRWPGPSGTKPSGANRSPLMATSTATQPCTPFLQSAKSLTVWPRSADLRGVEVDLLRADVDGDEVQRPAAPSRRCTPRASRRGTGVVSLRSSARGELRPNRDRARASPAFTQPIRASTRCR